MTDARKNSPLISTAWLSAHINDENVRVVDASWYLPNEKRDARKEYLNAHIPGAVFFDIDGIVDQTSHLPHMLASPDDFARSVGALGLSHDHKIIIYDGFGLRTAARAWWNFVIMGAYNVKVLAGGLPKWMAEKCPLETGESKLTPTLFEARPRTHNVASATDVQNALETGDAQIVDMRSAARFLGKVAEPRPGIRSGHMSGALNLPYDALIQNGTLLPPDAIPSCLAHHNIDPQKPIIATCGSGVTATLLCLALASIGVEAMRVYDGSWAEWGGDPERVVVSA